MEGRLKEDVASLVYYHPGVHRHQGETLLMHNGIAGTYLIRPNRDGTQFALSVRCQDSVQHFQITVDSGGIRFGHMSFGTAAELDAHLGKEPLLTSHDGVPVTLVHPYKRNVEECPIYASVVLHAETAVKGAPPRNLHLGVSTKAGYLEKYCGRLVKKWKVCWFVVQKTEFIRYKTSQSETPSERLDLSKCDGIRRDKIGDREHCFRLLFPRQRHSSLLLSSLSKDDLDDWMSILTFKVESLTAIPRHLIEKW